MRRTRHLIAGVLLAIATSVAQAATSTNAPLGSFIRYQSDGPQEGHVDTAVTTYTRHDGVKVTLFAALHIADRAYYEQMEKMFEQCDSVLYEMVRDTDVEMTSEIGTDNPLSQLQIGMKRMLGLEFQLEAIDYTRPNFVHADLDPDTFFRLQEERGESILGLMLQAILAEQARQANNPQGTVSGLQLLMAFLSTDRAHALKLLLGQQMEQMEAMLAGIDRGADGRGSVLVQGRNEHAMKVLASEIQRGKRRLGIFYGGGHMPDFERRLEALGFKKSDERWLVAWDIRRKTKARE
jgi:hypothetical protein